MTISATIFACYLSLTGRYSLQVPLPRTKSEHPSQNGHESDNEDSISEIDVENIVGVGSSSELEVLYSESNMHCFTYAYKWCNSL